MRYNVFVCQLIPKPIIIILTTKLCSKPFKLQYTSTKSEKTFEVSGLEFDILFSGPLKNHSV